jgi:hypothetical protein
MVPPMPHQAQTPRNGSSHTTTIARLTGRDAVTAELDGSRMQTDSRVIT